MSIEVDTIGFLHSEKINIIDLRHILFNYKSSCISPYCTFRLVVEFMTYSFRNQKI